MSSSPNNRQEDHDQNQSEKDWEGNLEKMSSMSNNTNNLNIQLGVSKTAADSKYSNC